MKVWIVVTLLTCYWMSSASAQSVGFLQKTINEETFRPLEASFWYPTEQSVSERIAENIAFIGTDVIKNATPSGQEMPIILLSHGYRGSWRNLNWLATKLAQQGYLVGAVDHPGTTTFQRSPEQASQWWQRPKDMSVLLDWVLTDPLWASMVDEYNISAIGHSLGGWTVMQLAGAEFNRQQLDDQCLRYPNPRVCGLRKELGLLTPQQSEPLTSDLADSRIQKVVSLDLGLARGFSIDSLSRLQSPVLILAAGIDIGDLPQVMESGFLAEHIPLPIRQYKVYQDATHFSFMQLCKPNAVMIIEEEEPGDGIICQDGKGADREELHQQMVGDILSFLKK